MYCVIKCTTKLWIVRKYISTYVFVIGQCIACAINMWRILLKLLTSFKCLGFVTIHQSSRAQILKKASDYIDFMRKKIASHQADIEDLQRQNELLDAQSKLLLQLQADIEDLQRQV